MLRRFTLAALGAIMLAPAAQAADLPEVIAAPEPFPIDAARWTGFFAGVAVGGARGDFDVTAGMGGTPTASAANNPFDELPQPGVSYGLSVDPKGLTGSVSAGYKYQFSAFVLGAEVEAGYLNLDESVRIETNASISALDDDFLDVEYGAYAAVFARAGFAYQNLMVYGKAGIGAVEIDANYGDLDSRTINGTTIFLPDPADVSGLEGGTRVALLGGGAEYSVTRNVSLKAEYMFMDIDGETTTNAAGETFETDSELHTLKGGVNVRF